VCNDLELAGQGDSSAVQGWQELVARHARLLRRFQSMQAPYVEWHNLHALLPTAPATAATFTDQNGQRVRMFTARAWTDCHINVNQQNNNCYAA